jgi:hypothetical protein
VAGLLGAELEQEMIREIDGGRACMVNERDNINKGANPGIKPFLFKVGLYGFLAGLVLDFLLLTLLGDAALWGIIYKNGQVPPLAESLFEGALPFIFPLPFLCFVILFISLLMKPRDMDMGAVVKSSMGGIITIVIGGILLSVVLLLGSMAAVMAVLYYRGNGIIFFAITYFIVSAIIFFLAGGYCMIRELAAAKELQSDTGWVKRIFGALRVGRGAAGPSLDARSRKVLSGIERLLGYILGVGLFILTSYNEIYEVIRRATGHGADNSILEELLQPNMLLAAMSLFIIVFSSLFIVGSVKAIFTYSPPDTGAGAPGNAATQLNRE